jgi:hypothetical protein
MERSAQLTTHDTDDRLDQPTREALFDPRSLIRRGRRFESVRGRRERAVHGGPLVFSEDHRDRGSRLPCFTAKRRGACPVIGKSPLAHSPDPQLETEAVPRRRPDAEKCAAL